MRRLRKEVFGVPLDVFEAIVREELAALFLEHGYTLTCNRTNSGDLAARFLKGETGFVFAKDYNSECLECMISVPAVLTFSDSTGHVEHLDAFQYAGLEWVLSLPPESSVVVHIGLHATEDAIRSGFRQWREIISSYAMDMVADESRILSKARAKGMRV